MNAERRPTAKGRPAVIRPAGYTWRLEEIAEAKGLKASVDLGPLLAQRGVILSDAQVYRLIHYTPERLSLRALSALCDIFGCKPNDLVETYVEGATEQLKAVGGHPRVGMTQASSGPELPEDFSPERADLSPTRKRP